MTDYMTVSKLRTFISAIEWWMIALVNIIGIMFTYLIIFKPLNTIFFTFDSLCFHRVWPILYSCLRSLLQCLSLGISHVLIAIFLRPHNLIPDSVEFIKGDNCSSLSFLLIPCTNCCDSSRVSWGRRLHICCITSTKRHFLFKWLLVL